MGKIAEHIQAERESARPVIEEYAPQLRTLANQVRELDPELAQTMADLADGHARGFNNLRAYIEERITDAQSAAEFSKAIDDAATEAGREAGIAEPAQPGPEEREAEGVLPGFARALEEERAAAGRYQGERLTEEINRPAESIEARAGEIERTSPLFRSTAASPQEEMFGAQPEREPTLAERRTQIDKRMAELEERDRVIAAGRPAPQGDIFDLVAAPEKPEAPGTLSANPVFDPAAWKAAFPAAGKAIRKFDDTTLSEGDLQKGIMREQTGELARKKAQLYTALDRQVKAWDKRSFNDQIDFILREQHGETQPNSTDQAIAD